MVTTLDMQTAALLSTFDLLSYNPGGLPLAGQQMPQGWELIPPGEPGAPLVEGSFSSYAYRNTTTNEVVIAYTGTNEFWDWPNANIPTLTVAKGVRLNCLSQVAQHYCFARIQVFQSSNKFLSRAKITERCQILPDENSSCSIQHA